MQGLPADMIADLMANSRSRNMYGPKLLEFCNSDEAAINPAESWPEFAGKKASSLYQSFRAQVEKADLKDTITVKLHNETCFLLHNERVKAVLLETAETEAA